jgi:hypothetical protein
MTNQAAGHPGRDLPLDLAKAEASDSRMWKVRCARNWGGSAGWSTPRHGSLGPIEHQACGGWLSLLRVSVAAPMGLTRSAFSMPRRIPVVFTLDNRGEHPRVLEKLRRLSGRGDAGAGTDRQ